MDLFNHNYVITLVKFILAKHFKPFLNENYCDGGGGGGVINS